MSERVSSKGQRLLKKVFRPQKNRPEKRAGTDSPDAVAETSTSLSSTVQQQPVENQPISTTSASDTHVNELHSSAAGLVQVSDQDATSNEPHNVSLSSRDSQSTVSRTPLWDEAVSAFRENHKEQYQDLWTPLEEAADNRNGSESGSSISVDFEQLISKKRLPKTLQKDADICEHAIMKRLKSWLPTIAAAKVVATALAKLDPHGLAPWLVAGTFFLIEIMLNSIPADQKEATLEIICDSVIILLKWRSYEENISEIHHTTLEPRNKSVLQSLQSDLPHLYTCGLKLQARIRHAARFRRAFSSAAVSGTLEAWKIDLGELKRQDRHCSATKDKIKDRLERQDQISKILKILRKDGDVYPLHEDIKKNIDMHLPEYQGAGSWFLRRSCFHNWMDSDNERPTPRVIWLKGTMGTGKTTLMCQAISKFCQDQDQSPTGSFRVEYYYCSASATGASNTSPGKETIIRSLCRRLAWQSTDNIAPAAHEFYRKFAPESADPPGLPDWENLFKRLIMDASDSVLLIIDALDECAEANDLVSYLSKCTQSCGKLYLLLSSRQHVRVEKYFESESIAQVDTIEGKHEPDMRIFIQTAIELRKKEPETKESIFFGSSPISVQLLSDLKEALSKRGDGMFRWVDVWLSVLFPPDPVSQIFENDDAGNLIGQINRGESESGDGRLSNAYKTLWERNSRVRHRELQPRLFQLVLCALDKLTLKQITEALRVDPKGEKPYRTDLQPQHVEWLCYNFLVATDNGFEWAHQSAKDFITQNGMGENITDFSEASNNVYVSQIALQLLTQLDHPAWREAGFHLSHLRSIRVSEYLVSKLPSLVGEALDEAERELAPGNPSEPLSYKITTEIDIRKWLLSRLRSSDDLALAILEALFAATSFASYVLARFLHHLRIAFDLSASDPLLEELMRLAISSSKSALPAVMSLFDLSGALGIVASEEVENRYSCMISFPARQFLVELESGSILPTRIAEIDNLDVRSISMLRDGRKAFVPLSFLVVVNAASKLLFQDALAATTFESPASDWNVQLASSWFMACHYKAMKSIQVLLALTELNSLPSGSLLRTMDNSGRLAIHIAAYANDFAMVKVLTEADDKNSSNPDIEYHSKSGSLATSENNKIPLLYASDTEGMLPMHLVSHQGEPSMELVNWMLQYDHDHANLFPEIAEQQDCDITNHRRTSMLITKDKSGCLPVHYIINNAVLQAVLDHEIKAYKRYKALRSDCQGADHIEPRSKLLYARSENNRLPIDVWIDSGILYWPDSPSVICDLVDTMLDFEEQWLGISSTERTAKTPRQSPLLHPLLVAKLVRHWLQGSFEPMRLAKLFDKYELQPSILIFPWLGSGPRNMHIWPTEDYADGERVLAARREANATLLPRIKELVSKRLKDSEAVERDCADDSWREWDDFS